MAMLRSYRDFSSRGLGWKHGQPGLVGIKDFAVNLQCAEDRHDESSVAGRHWH